MSGDWQDRGEPWRALFGIDGTAGDAQDIDHPYVPDSPNSLCSVCGLNRSFRRHTEKWTLEEVQSLRDLRALE